MRDLARGDLSLPTVAEVLHQPARRLAAAAPVGSVINVTQVATIDRAALVERVGELPDWLLAQVAQGYSERWACPEPERERQLTLAPGQR